MGIKGAKEYKTGHHFRVETLRTSAIMQEYYFFLKDKGINIENVISWFFSDYLREKYGLADWRFNASSENSRFAEKCKNLSSEMEAVLKQYKMYEETGAIDRELFEIASSHITFTSLSSLIRDKYAYINSKKLQKELNMLFSNQCMLLYVPDHKGYHDFASLVKTEKISIDDYNKNRKSDLDFLIKRNTIFVDELGNITPNDSRIMLLADLYDNDVLCLVYCDDFRDIIDELISEKEIVVENKLLTRPEIDYMNYMLNKSTFSNGWDLRNRYAHGTYSKNEDEQARDYFELLKIMIMVLLKIKEEFELKFGRSL